MHATTPWYASYNSINIDDLGDIAKHHQNQIENNKRILTTKEQETEMAKQQHDQTVCLKQQQERLDQLVEMISSQDAKLNRLKALRSLVQQQSSANFELSNELNSINATISSKDEELRKALDLVDNLNRQLSNFRKTRPSRHSKFSSTTNGAHGKIKINQHNTSGPVKLAANSNIESNHKHISVSDQQPVDSNNTISNNKIISMKIDQTKTKDRQDDKAPNHDNNSLKINGSMIERSMNQNGEELIPSSDDHASSELSSPTIEDTNLTSALPSTISEPNNKQPPNSDNCDEHGEDYPKFDVNIAQLDETNKKTNVSISKDQESNNSATGVVRRVSFDPLALLLDAALEGELELVKRTSKEVADISAPNDEGVTALHNAIVAGHADIVKYLVESGCDVNVQDSNGWTPLHCAASCNNRSLIQFLVEHGALIYATTLHDDETAAQKCEDGEENFDECIEYLSYIQENLGILNGGRVYALFDYEAQNNDELSFENGELLIVLRKDDDQELEWWWARKTTSINEQKDKLREGYIPRNLVGLYPRVMPACKMELKSQPSNALNNSC